MDESLCGFFFSFWDGSHMKLIQEDWNFFRKAGFQGTLIPRHWFVVVIVMEILALFCLKVRKLSESLMVSHLWKMELNLPSYGGVYRSCKKGGIFWLWSFCNGLSRVWPFRWSSWPFSKPWEACQWCRWALLQHQSFTYLSWTIIWCFRGSLWMVNDFYLGKKN